MDFNVYFEKTDNTMNTKFSDLPLIQGPPGPQGPPGSDAAVTAENIAAALGYNPASEQQFDSLTSDLNTFGKAINNTVQLKDSSYVKASTGSILGGYNYTKAAEYVGVYKAKSVFLNKHILDDSTSEVYGYAFYDGQHKYISGAAYSTTDAIYIEVPSEARYFSFTVANECAGDHVFAVKYDENDIFNNLEQVEFNIVDYTNSVKMTVGGYINKSGNVAGVTWSSYSDYIDITETPVNAIFTCLDTALTISFYRDDKSFISCITNPSEQTKWNVFNAPDGTKYIRFTNGTKDNSYVKCICVKGKYALDHMKDTEKLVNPITMYDKIVCCGDSLTYGLVYTSGNARQSFSPYPLTLGRMFNATSMNLGRSGATALSWWDIFSNQLSESEGLHIVFLGTNGGLTDTIDNDCVGDDLTQFANTNTGAYGKILQTIKDKGDKAILVKVFAGDTMETTNTVIESFGELYNFPVIDVNNNDIDNPNYHFYPDKTGSNSLHFNDLGYVWLANQIKRCVLNLSPSEQFNIMRTR